MYYIVKQHHCIFLKPNKRETVSLYVPEISPIFSLIYNSHRQILPLISLPQSKRFLLAQFQYRSAFKPRTNCNSNWFLTESFHYLMTKFLQKASFYLQKLWELGDKINILISNIHRFLNSFGRSLLLLKAFHYCEYEIMNSRVKNG